MGFDQQMRHTPYVDAWRTAFSAVTVTNDVPQWWLDAKFGIFLHWGPYAVHAYGSNTTWYAYSMYWDQKIEDARQHFEKNFGKLTPEYGYKDLITMFTAEKFDANEWADLFKKSGAQFAGPVAQHHDGFAMWDSKLTEWNSKKMGPKRDVVGELEKAIKNHNLCLRAGLAAMMMADLVKGLAM